MNEAELKEKIIATALEWRELDESEPIPSDVVGNKLTELVFLIDDLRKLQGKI